MAVIDRKVDAGGGRHGGYIREFNVSDLPNSYTFPGNNSRDEHLPSIKTQNRDDWFGSTEKEAVEVLNVGWLPGAHKIEELSAKIERAMDGSPVIPVAFQDMRKRKPRWTDMGDELDITRSYTGNIDTAWWGRKNLTGKHFKGVTIFSQWSYSAWQDAKELHIGPSIAIAICDIVERAGYAVRLVGSNCVGARGGHTIGSYMVAKHSEHPLRTDIVAAALAHPGVYRRFGIPSVPVINEIQIDHGWGTVLEPKIGAEFAERGGMVDKDDVVIIVGNFFDKDLKKQVEHALRVLKAGYDAWERGR